MSWLIQKLRTRAVLILDTPGGETNAKYMREAAEAIEALEAVASAAKRYKIFQDQWGNKGQLVAGHYEAWLATQEALEKASGYYGETIGEKSCP